MMAKALCGARIFTGEEMLADYAVVVTDGRIEALMPADRLPPEMQREALPGGYLVPGFIDVQVNGGGGVLFNDQPTVDGIAAIGRAHRRFGTTGFLPTLMTDTRARMRDGIAAARSAIDASVPGVLGIHLEGPYISPERKGIHNPAAIRPMEPDAVALLASLERGRTLVTLAPERVPAGVIRRLVAAGVIVSAGHTNGGYADLRAALDEGLSGFTHLFNAMSQLTAREPGAIGAALDDPVSYCGLIVDGLHVHPASLRLALAAKSPARLMLVTDAMPVTGSDSNTFELYGRTIHCSERRCTAADGTLAGADLDMATAVGNAIRLLGVPLEDALRMASTSPAAFLGLDHELGRIAPGYRANLVLLDDAFAVHQCWINGRDMSQDGLG